MRRKQVPDIIRKEASDEFEKGIEMKWSPPVKWNMFMASKPGHVPRKQVPTRPLF